MFAIIVAMSIASVHGARLTPMPGDGDRAVYYDVTSSGTLLEISYAAGSAREVAHIPLAAFPANVVLSGWYLPEKEAAYLFAHVPGRREDELYLFDIRSMRLLETGVQLNTSGDSNVLPVSKDIVYVRNFEEDSSRIYHPSTDSESHESGFELRHGTEVHVADDGATLLVEQGLAHDTLLRIDAYTGEMIEEYKASMYVGGDTRSGQASFICFEENEAVIRSASHGGYRMHYVDLRLGTVLASSEIFPEWFHVRSILQDSEMGHTLYLVGLERTAGDSEPTGAVRGFSLSPGAFVELPPVEYDAATQLFLLKNSGGYVVCDRVRFDYVSMSDLYGSAKWLDVETLEEREAAVEAWREQPGPHINMSGRVPLTLEQASTE